MQQNLQLIKTPPHSQETEQLILGSILVNPLLFDEILLKPEIFYFKLDYRGKVGYVCLCKRSCLTLVSLIPPNH